MKLGVSSDFYFVLCVFVIFIAELDSQIEMMKAVSFMYIRPPGYDPESAKAAECADEKHQGSSSQDPTVDDNVGSMYVDRNIY